MHYLLDYFKALTDPTRLAGLLSGPFAGGLGYLLLSLILFAETGLLVGFVLPGDSLLFAVGVVCGLGYLKWPVVVLVLTCAAILGDNLGYFLGRTAGPHVFSRPKSRLFNPAHIQRAHEFYERHGGLAIVYARFVPVIRTCMPFMAGVAGMRYTRFLGFSLFGGFGWIVAMTFIGFELGGIPFVRRNIEVVIVSIAVVSLIPVFLQIARRRGAR